jgi:hypothetical protein
VPAPSKFKNDLTLANYMLPGFGHMAFSYRQMLLPHGTIHCIKPRANTKAYRAADSGVYVLQLRQPGDVGRPRLIASYWDTDGHRGGRGLRRRSLTALSWRFPITFWESSYGVR